MRVVEIRQNAVFVEVAVGGRRRAFVRRFHDDEEIPSSAPQRKHEQIKDGQEFAGRPPLRLLSMENQHLVGQKRDEDGQNARTEEILRHVLPRHHRVHQPDEQQQGKHVKGRQLRVRRATFFYFSLRALFLFPRFDLIPIDFHHFYSFPTHERPIEGRRKLGFDGEEFHPGRNDGQFAEAPTHDGQIPEEKKHVKDDLVVETHFAHVPHGAQVVED